MHIVFAQTLYFSATKIQDSMRNFTELLLLLFITKTETGYMHFMTSNNRKDIAKAVHERLGQNT